MNQPHWILRLMELRRSVRLGDLVLAAVVLVGWCWCFWRVVELLSA